MRKAEVMGMDAQSRWVGGALGLCVSTGACLGTGPRDLKRRRRAFSLFLRPRWCLCSHHPNPTPAVKPPRYYQMAHMREEKITQQPGLLRPPKGAALREYQVGPGRWG
jgi:hypothetical protein